MRKYGIFINGKHFSGYGTWNSPTEAQAAMKKLRAEHLKKERAGEWLFQGTAQRKYEVKRL